MVQLPREAALLVVVYLDMNLGDPEMNNRDKSITADFSKMVLEETSGHLLLYRTSWARDCRTWIIFLQGRLVRSRMDYMLWTDHHMLRKRGRTIPKTLHRPLHGTGLSPRLHQEGELSLPQVPSLPPEGDDKDRHTF